MRFLLDTHVFLWWLKDDRRLDRVIAQPIQDPANEIYVSTVTAWEIVIKASLKRLRFPVAELSKQLELNAFAALPVTVAHAEQLHSLPPLHRDPFDRMLIAQAQAEQLALLSQDEQVLQYPSVSRQ
jgi:PIN domain nuclease of toxin-antitoxin system